MTTTRNEAAGLRVGEAAREAGVSIDTLRYYERENLLRTERTASGHRRYSQGDLDWIGVLTCLRDTGMPIRRMREFATLVGEDDDATIGARIELLDEHRTEVLRQIRELQSNLERVEGKLAWYRSRLG
ncbi:MerR family transcriptional regulator [Terrabacter sp. MAHUQ-38]|jgi:DNA-binding transcriptional MerR regulator|uniref:MerR family transcriptional regulator n=1 Tax=unclassified Terrabacter TaxID=2630222 RepID=UPI00165DE63D|nr:MerR family transcriptional regulator [Terrabacter sp. MAHUQ-38]MBC9819910.1 MerR family transcriptional regulator [Terrabacter sp. MAHUQ-38]